MLVTNEEQEQKFDFYDNNKNFQSFVYWLIPWLQCLLMSLPTSEYATHLPTMDRVFVASYCWKINDATQSMQCQLERSKNSCQFVFSNRIFQNGHFKWMTKITDRVKTNSASLLWPNSRSAFPCFCAPNVACNSFFLPPTSVKRRSIVSRTFLFLCLFVWSHSRSVYNFSTHLFDTGPIWQIIFFAWT